MRVICDKCHGKARITTRREITPRFTKLYCVCNNAECGHSFVMHLEFAHTLSPSGFENHRQMHHPINTDANHKGI